MFAYNKQEKAKKATFFAVVGRGSTTAPIDDYIGKASICYTERRKGKHKKPKKAEPMWLLCLFIVPCLYRTKVKFKV
jgi:hypothetical protein